MGNIVKLTSLKSEDVPILFEWINDRSLARYSRNFKPIHHKNHLEWFDSIRSREDVRIFAIRLVSDGVLLGSCQLSNISPVNNSAEFKQGFHEHPAKLKRKREPTNNWRNLFYQSASVRIPSIHCSERDAIFM